MDNRLKKQRSDTSLRPSTGIENWLSAIERAGNRLPHPAMLFIYLALTVLLGSAIASWSGLSAIHPISQASIEANNLLTGEGLRRILSEAVMNFTQFAPVGVVLVAMLGIGIAEHSGFIATLLKRLVRRSSGSALAYVIAFAGIMSSIAADVGYVVLLPLAGMIFHAANRPPLAGIAVAFAGVSAGYSANLVIGPVDVLLAGISTEAAQLVELQAEVSASDNYYFIALSTLFITMICGLVSNRLIEPRLSQTAIQDTNKIHEETESEGEARLLAVGIFTLAYIALIAALTLPGTGPLAVQQDGSNPLVKSIVALVSIYFGLAGYIFGRSNEVYHQASDMIVGMESAMASMAYYLVLMFFAAQFVNYFSWSNLGLISAIQGAAFIGQLELSAGALLAAVITLSALINLLIGSASAKWTLLAPIFVPMFMLLGVSAEKTQMAYRIGDSTTNIITPLMPYFGIALAYIQRYQRDAGLGTVVALMLPYSVTLFFCWGVLGITWITLGLPLGP